MAVKDVIKVSRKTFFAPGSWLGFDFLKTQSVYLWQFFKRLIGGVILPPKPEQIETFEQAMQRLNVAEERLEETSQLYLLFAGFFCLLAVMVLIISVLFLLEAHLAACLISLAIVVFLLAQAFRYHFWRFQIKHRKLGCTFEEWRHGKLE